MSPLAEVLRVGLERLVRRRPDAFQANLALDAVFDKPTKAGAKSERQTTSRQIRKGATDDDLLAAAGAVLVNPDFAVAAGGCLRPAVMHALAHGLDALLASAATGASKGRAAAEGTAEGKARNKGGGSKASATDTDDETLMTSATTHERACAALALLLELLPHIKPVVARYLRVTAAPFARVVRFAVPTRGGHECTEIEINGGGASGVCESQAPTDPAVEARDHVLLVTRASVRLLRQFHGDNAGGGSVNESQTSANSANENDADETAEHAKTAPGANAASPLRKWDLASMVRLLSHADCEIRWTVCMALEVVFGLPPNVASRLQGSHATDVSKKHGFTETWTEITASIELERASAFLDPGEVSIGGGDEDFDDDTESCPQLPGHALPAAPGHARVGGVEVRLRLRDDDERSPNAEANGGDRGLTETETATAAATKQTRRGPPMVRTPSSTRNVEATALALCQNRPLLLEGPAGCGKSSVLEEVAARTHNDDFVVLHLDAQSDSKSLLGTYVVGSTPGEFNWKPGALTQAVREGRWVVIEDVDQAPFEVLAALIPLLEERKLYIPGRGESIGAHEGFQLFGTATTGAGRAGGLGAASGRQDPLAGLWARVAVEPPVGDEPALVLTGAHPNLEPLAPLMLETLNVVQRMCGVGGGAAAPGGYVALDVEVSTGGIDETTTQQQQIQAATDDVNPDTAPGVARAHAGRAFTLRDLLRWARRIERLHAAELSLLRPGISKTDNLPPKVKAAAYEEAVDVLCGMLPSGSGRGKILNAVGRIWGITADDVWHRDAVCKPSLREGNGAIGVGRATLPAERSADEHDGMNAKNANAATRWSNTGHALRILERVATAVQCVEPVLLVGETGTGKTALVQQLSSLTGAPLTVVNLSNQSESSDFLGGFKPAGARHLCLPLLPRFRACFQATFSNGHNDEFLTRVNRYAEKRKWTHLLHAFRVGVERVAKLANEFDTILDDDSETNKSAVEKETTTPTEEPSLATHLKRVTRRKGKKVTSVDEGHEDPGAVKVTAPTSASNKRRKKKALPDSTIAAWHSFDKELSVAERALASTKSGPVFAFVEGALVTALREGHWILLDEINLAPAETLERLSGVLESAKGSLVLSERGDGHAIKRHPRFRVFGAMNPATDVGKRDLPAALKHRFTEVFCGECEGREDLSLLVSNGLRGVPAAPVDAVVDFYLAARLAARRTLNDSADQKPQYSLRTLTRAMEYVRHAAPVYGIQRALYDGFAMSFQTLLKRTSYEELEKLMVNHLLRGVALKAIFKAPASPPGDGHVLVEQYWVAAGEGDRVDPESSGRYIVTPNVRAHLSALARACLLRRHPILLQGPTSSGKTSLVEYLAQRTGHRFVRINNHEHTDLQEYLGSYVTDAEGKLTFQEGALVQAVRKGWWIVLDELNLAPSDVLEALNRLLDDNRELFVPELQETIKPHPHFALFATQNPPGVTYGGRKVLSKAFRNRFMEIHVGDIPDDELRVILNKRCGVAPSYASKIVEVMRDLQRRRAASRAFAGKDGFVTARDLFRWANRKSNGYEELAQDGFRVLGERVRSEEERDALKQTLIDVLKVKDFSVLSETKMYVAADGDALKLRLHDAAAGANASANDAEVNATSPLAKAEASQARRDAEDAAALSDAMAWTPAAKRLFSLVETCLEHKEPALLVGETGCGKTSIVQLLSLLRGQKLRILNCHQHTETGDFLGGFRPTRRSAGEQLVGGDNGIDEESDENETEKETQNQNKLPFAWEDGPLVLAMKHGDILLVDELSLAEDSVLERLNSVLEPGRTLTLPEKGGAEVEELVAHPNFRIIGTMNPGGDFGKKELSPALRNRFCEIWIGASNSEREMAMITAQRIPEPELAPYSSRLAEFWSFYREAAGRGAARGALLTRDLVAWAQFMRASVVGDGGSSEHPVGGGSTNATDQQPSVSPPRRLTPEEAYVHGAYLTLLDGLGLGLGLPEETAKHLANECEGFLRRQLPKESHYAVDAASNPGGTPRGRDGAVDANEQLVGASRSTKKLAGMSDVTPDGCFVDDDQTFGVVPFVIPRGLLSRDAIGTVNVEFDLNAPSATRNAARVLRAMQLTKPILLEGSPGVGKTSLISALAKASGHRLTRINLSEQTDMMDLLGADLPADGGAAGEFRWADGAFLSALRRGDWVLLDELNLAPQPVLEGLNAALDHRAEVFVPELGETFRCPPTFRVFACQNPVAEGGGRKGLPKSFLNRFTRVHVEAMEFEDMTHIVRSLFPKVPLRVVENAITFVTSLANESKAPGSCFARTGSPWEFNLRDVLRWLELGVVNLSRGDDNGDSDDTVDTGPDDTEDGSPFDVDKITSALDVTHRVLFSQRLRVASDRATCAALFANAFGRPSITSGANYPPPSVTVVNNTLHVGNARLPRFVGGTTVFSVADSPAVLKSQTAALEAACYCAARGWMTILVGPASSGKTSVAKTLADLSGRTLRRVALTAATDTSELLGSFEQKEPARDRASLEDEVLSQLREVASRALDVDSTHKNGHNTHLLVSVEHVWQMWSKYQNLCEQCAARTATATDAAGAREALLALILALAATKLEISKSSRSLDASDAMSVDGETTEDTTTDSQLSSSCLERASQLGHDAWGGAATSAGRFEWVDGVLLRAATRGEWVLLENANLCSPTVLDRLNPLLEQGGSLLVSECGMRDGQPRVVRAHANFRLFLALDPRRGEVSRAMRNRGVEVFMAGGEKSGVGGSEKELSEKLAVKSSSIGSNSETLPSPLHALGSDKDQTKETLLGVLAASGVPAGAVRLAMAEAHLSLIRGDFVFLSEESPDLDFGVLPVDSRVRSVQTTTERTAKEKAESRAFAVAHFAQITVREASVWGKLTVELLARGASAASALRTAWDHVYSRGEASERARGACAFAFVNAVGPYLLSLRKASDASNTPASITSHSVLVEPAGWPDKLTASSLTRFGGTEHATKRAGALVETIAGVLFGRELGVSSTHQDSGSEYSETELTALAAVGLPLFALQRRMGLETFSSAVSSPDDTEKAMDTEAENVASVKANPASAEIVGLTLGLRASGHAFLTGTAFGSSRGLDCDQLADAAAWLRRLAVRFSYVNSSTDVTTENSPVSVVPTKPSPNPGTDGLGVSFELISLAVAADALAALAAVTHTATCAVNSTTRNAPYGQLPGTCATKLLQITTRGLICAARNKIHCDLRTSGTAVAADVASVAQLGVWFTKHPDAKDRGQRAHALVDALAPVLESAFRFEQVSVSALGVVLGKAAKENGNGEQSDCEKEDACKKNITHAVTCLAEAQDWRLRLESLACGTPSRAMRAGENGSPPDAATVQRFATTYHLTRAAFAKAGTAVAAANAGGCETVFVDVLAEQTGVDITEPTEPACSRKASKKTRTSKKASSKRTADIRTSPALAWDQWHRASSRADTALGVPPGDPPPPLLWRRAGRPSMPRFETLRVAEDRTRALCAALRPGLGSVAALAAQASSLADEEGEDRGMSRQDVLNDLTFASSAARAAVGTPAGAALRSAALEGLCFFAWTHARDVGNQTSAPQIDSANAGAKGSDASAFLEREAGAIPSTLAKECFALAEAGRALREPETQDTAFSVEDTPQDDDTAMAVTSSPVDGVETDGTDVHKTQYVPPAYSLPSNALLRSADQTEVTSQISKSGTQQNSPTRGPPLGFPAWSRKWPICAAAHDALMPLLEVHSVATQFSVLTDLMGLVVSGVCQGADKQPSSSPSQAALLAIAAGLKFGVENSPRDPADFMAHRHVLWLAETGAAGSGEETRDMNDAKWQNALPALVLSSWRAWHVASWGGALNDPYVTAALSTRRRKSRAERVDVNNASVYYDTDVARSHVVKHWLESVGPARCEGAVVTTLAAAILAGAPSGVAFRAARMLQLRLASRALRLRRPPLIETSQHEWQSLGALTVQIVLAHVTDGDEKDHQSLRKTCAAILEHCSFEVKHLEKDECQKIDLQLETRAAAASELVARFEKDAHSVRHVTFQNALQTLLVPLVKAVLTGVNRFKRRALTRTFDVSTSTVGAISHEQPRNARRAFANGDAALSASMAEKRDRFNRGAAWAFLGLARLGLLLPDGTPDPAAATEARVRLAFAKIANEIKPGAAALVWQAETPAASAPNEFVVALFQEDEKGSANDVARLQNRWAQRPRIPKWASLMLEQGKFRDHLGGVARVLGVVGVLSVGVADDDHDHDDDEFSRFSSELSSDENSKRKSIDGPTLQRARAEAKAWLDASAAWEERLEISFRGYRDATEPLRLAVCEIRRGVSLALASCADPAEDARLVEVADLAEKKKTSKKTSGVETFNRNKHVASHHRATASATAAHLMAYPPLALTAPLPPVSYGQTVTGGTFSSSGEVSSSAVALASASAQKAFSCLERLAAVDDANARVDGGGNDGQSVNTSAIISAAKLRVAALRAALAAVEEEARAAGSLSPAHWRRCSQIFTSLSSLWAHSRDAEAEATAEAHALFKTRTKGATAAETLEGDDEVSEELAYERAFGRHAEMFADLQIAPDGVEQLGDDDDVNDELIKKKALRKALRSGTGGDSDDDDDSDDDNETDDETKARVHAAKLAGLLEGDLLEEVVSAHRRLLGGLLGPPAPPPPPTSGSVDPATQMAAQKDPSGWWAVSGAKPSPQKYGKVLSPDEAVRAEQFEKAHDAGVRISIAVGAENCGSQIDQVVATGLLLRAALEHACASRPAITPAEDAAAPMVHLIGNSADEKSANALAGGDGDFGDDDDATIVEKHDPSADAAADALGADLNQGGCAGEMGLVVAPVAATLKRITELLTEWPDHPLLTQLAEICNRVLQLPLLSPLKQALTGLELLLARAQTWEEGAAAHVSLKDQLALCAQLALKWRQRELRTWPRLLARAQERHVTRAHRAWFALHRLLRPPSDGNSGAVVAVEVSKQSAENDDITKDDPSNLLGIDASGLTQSEREGLRQVTIALEEFVQGSTIGEFRARLDLLWQFHADLFVEAAVMRMERDGRDGAAREVCGEKTTTHPGIEPDTDLNKESYQSYHSQHKLGARETALACVLYNTWRYYAQFLPSMQRRVEAARQPAAKKLRDHAKLAKWEDRGYHAMKTSGESNQRSMHKFVRAFDTSLNALALPALQLANNTTGFGDLQNERSAADRAATAATAAQTAKETKNAATVAKNSAAENERREHKLSSAGETNKDRARRVVAEEAAEVILQKTLEADRKKAIAEASRVAFDSAEALKASARLDELVEFSSKWKNLGLAATVGASNAKSVLTQIKTRMALGMETRIKEGMGVESGEQHGTRLVPLHSSLRLDDVSLYQTKLESLTKRVASVLGSAFTKLDDDSSVRNDEATHDQMDEETDDAFVPSVTTFARGGVDVDAFASSVAARCVSLRDDATAKKNTKKKAFVDLLKALPELGIRSVRKAVPESQRNAESWFREPPMERPGCLPKLAPVIAEAFDAADSYYYKSMARTSRLRETRVTANGDLTSREIETVTGSVEHLLFLLRKQRRVVRLANGVETEFHEVCEALRGVLADVTVTNDSQKSLENVCHPPPRQAATRLWTLRQRSLLDKLLASTKAAMLVHKAVSHCESLAELRPGGDVSNTSSTLLNLEKEIEEKRTTLAKTLVPSLKSRRESHETHENAWTTRNAFFATKRLSELLGDNYAWITEAAQKVQTVYLGAVKSAERAKAPSGTGDFQKAWTPLPGWEPLRGLLENGVSDAAGFQQSLQGDRISEENARSDTDKAQTVYAHANAFSTAVERCVGAGLVWAQSVKRASENGEEISGSAETTKENGDESVKNAEPVPTLVGAEQTLQGAMSLGKLAKCARHAREACDALSAMTDAAYDAQSAENTAEKTAETTQVIAAAAARAAELAPLLLLLRDAYRRAFGEYIAFHRSSAKLEAVLSSLAVGVCLEGFCARQDEQDGEDGAEGGKMMDDVGGTGMGEGEGKNDVSDEIEDEEQILGQEDMEKQDEKDDEDGGDKNDDKGIEMQNDFEADAKNLSDDEKGDDDDDQDDQEKSENGDDIEKEMGQGEDDDNAEVVDEKVWDQEDDEEEKDKPEDEKQKEQDKYEKGSTVKQKDAGETETRAADETDKDDRKDTDRDAKDDKEDKKEDQKDAENDENPPEDKNENEDPKDENDGVNQEEIEENHGIAPKGAEENGDDENGADDDLELPDDMQLDGEDEGGAGEDAEGDDKNSDGEKMDDDVDDGAGENGDAGDDDRNETNAEDENGGGELDQVMEKVDGGDDDEKAEEDENAGGAAEDDTGNIGEDDEGVQGGPSGAGTGGGVGEDDDDAAKQDNGDQGGDVGAGAEGEGEETTLADARAKPAPGFDDAGDFENGDTDNNGVDQNQSALEAPGGGGEGGGGGASASAAGEGAAAPLADGEAPPPAGASMPPPPPRKKPEGNDANPHRSLGDALKGWREKLSVIGDAVERPDSSVGEKRDADENDAVELPAREYEFERDGKESGGAAGDEDEAHGEGKGGGVQALAGATKEQAAAAAANGLDRSQNPAGEGVENENAEPIAPVADDSDAHSDDKNQKELPQELPENRNEMDVDTATATDDVDDDSPDDIQDPNKGKSLEERGAAKARRKGKATDDKKPKNLKESLGAGVGITEDVPGDEGADGEIDENDAFGGRGELGEETVVTLKALEDVSLDDAEREDVSPEELSPEEIASARAEAVAALGEWRERTASGAGGSDHLAHALWNHLELLTGALSGELAEQLRLILEPTLASRLTGDFRTGKRLNMRKIIPYIASDYRKDKIWLRRSKPSQRKYQVVLAIDDSKSMTENACGHLALESTVLIARAMSRLEVGEIGVVSFGADGGWDAKNDDGELMTQDDLTDGVEVPGTSSGGIRTLHPLGAPFSDQNGPSLVSQFTFSQDNTLADQPVVGLLKSLDKQLSAARENLRGGAGDSLQQLCLIIADGRFHEKEALRRQMREMQSRRGVLVAFIVLDNPKSSVLDMQTVDFANGKPNFTKYLDTFPFPFYTLVQDIAKLPAVISDLLRQWFEITAGG